MSTASTCTLRAALSEANALDARTTINFAMANCAGLDCSIEVTAALPTITARGTIVDGSSQTGTDCGDLLDCVEPTWRVHLAGKEALELGLAVEAEDVELRGLDIRAKFQEQIRFNGRRGRLTCSRLAGGDFGVRITGADSVIGGTVAGDGNVIENHVIDGVHAPGPENGPAGLKILGNLVRGNEDGIYVVASDVRIGSLDGGRNIVFGNTHWGINVWNSSGAIVEGNLVGPDCSGDRIPNTAGGIDIHLCQTATVQANVVAKNSRMGVLVENGSVHTVLHGNRIGTDAAGMEDQTFCNGFTQVDDQGEGTISIDNEIGLCRNGCCAYDLPNKNSVRCVDFNALGGTLPLSDAVCTDLIDPVFGAAHVWFNPYATCNPNGSIQGECAPWPE